MAYPVEPAAFLREFVIGLFESRLLNGAISVDEYHDRLAAIRKDKKFVTMSRRLFGDAPEPVRMDGYGLLRIIELREPDGSRFPFLQGLTKSGPSDQKRLTCFVGHRFLQNIEHSLRFNLCTCCRRMESTSAGPGTISAPETSSPRSSTASEGRTSVCSTTWAL